jgi:hypothetical protein
MARRRRQGSPLRMFAVLAAAVCVVAGVWWLDAAFEQRHWREFQDAGDRAYQRGNLRFAESMYREALQYAEAQEDVERAVRSCARLRRLYLDSGNAQGARDMVKRARRIRQEGSG